MGGKKDRGNTMTAEQAEERNAERYVPRLESGNELDQVNQDPKIEDENKESPEKEVDTRSHYAKYTGAHKKYEKSEKGKVARERYMNSDKGKAARKRYRAKRDAENKRILQLAKEAGIGQN